MSIRLQSPDARLLSPDSLKPPAWRQPSRRSDRIKNFLRTGAGRILICAVALWLIFYAYCHHRYWRDPDSWFYSDNGVYDFHYSQARQQSAAQFITEANSTAASNATGTAASPDILCIGIVTVKRKHNVDYLNGTIGSMLMGLTPEERSAINVQLVFADPKPERHPEWNQTWLNVVDSWSTYNVSDEQFEDISRWKKEDDVQRKGTYDYTYILDHCYNHTTAPYIAIFEDDLIFADGWLPKTLSALSSIRQKSTDWLYLRLFYTESILGWDKDVDNWYTHPIFLMVMTLMVLLTTTLGIRFHLKRINQDRDTSILLVFGTIVLPLFTILIFMIGKNSLLPIRGLHRMDQKGCCTQALIYPRYQVSNLSKMLLEREPSQTDLVIDEWADEMGLARYALSPQVLQHIGLISTRGMPKKYTRQTWAYYFEDSDAKQLKREHEDLARWGIWRAADEDYASIER